jgi:hypothetical protein
MGPNRFHFRSWVFKNQGWENKDFAPLTFPEFPESTAVIGVCGVGTIKGAAPQEDGLFISDFLAISYLLHGVSHRQTWLSAFSLEELVDKHKEYLHGYGEGKKIVLDTKNCRAFQIALLMHDSRLFKATVAILRHQPL